MLDVFARRARCIGAASRACVAGLTQPSPIALLEAAFDIRQEVFIEIDVAQGKFRIGLVAAEDARAAADDFAQKRYAGGGQVNEIDRAAGGERKILDEADFLLG
jgi:hypothetical protein